MTDSAVEQLALVTKRLADVAQQLQAQVGRSAVPTAPQPGPVGPTASAVPWPNPWLFPPYAAPTAPAASVPVKQEEAKQDSSSKPRQRKKPDKAPPKSRKQQKKARAKSSKKTRQMKIDGAARIRQMAEVQRAARVNAATKRAVRADIQGVPARPIDREAQSLALEGVTVSDLYTEFQRLFALLRDEYAHLLRDKRTREKLHIAGLTTISKYYSTSGSEVSKSFHSIFDRLKISVNQEEVVNWDIRLRKTEPVSIPSTDTGAWEAAHDNAEASDSIPSIDGVNDGVVKALYALADGKGKSAEPGLTRAKEDATTTGKPKDPVAAGGAGEATEA